MALPGRCGALDAVGYDASRFRRFVVKVRRIMTTDVVSVKPDTTFKDVVEQLVAAGVSGLPVVDDRGVLVAIITEADLVAKEAYPGQRSRALGVLADVLSAREHHWVTKARGWTAADIMTTNVETCAPDDDVRLAARRMLAHGVKRMPVLEGGKLVGIVSRRDILRGLVRPDAEIAQDVTHLLKAAPDRPDDHHVTCSVEDGKVVLSGDVRYAWDEPTIVAMVRGVDGVIDVVSHVRHREASPNLPRPPWPLGGRS
jgi:CBS domain-containing protein